MENFIQKYINDKKFPQEFFNSKKLLNFNPTNREGLIMFGLYIGLILFLFKKNGYGLIFWLMSIFLYTTTKEELKQPCRESTVNNPHANTLWDNDNLTSCKASKKTIKDNFEENLYRNETDLFDRKSMQGLYFTIQNKYPNDIRPFLKELDSKLRCKDKNENCEFPSFF
jgi:hypothetical protein